MVVLAMALQAAAASPARRSVCEPECGVEVSEPVRAKRPASSWRYPAARPAFPGVGSVGVPSNGGSGARLVQAGQGGAIEPVLEAGALSPGPRVLDGMVFDTDPQLFDYSDGYYARLSLHRLASYATLPLFVAQFVAGEELLSNVDHAARWARVIHGPAAAGVAGLFLVNTVTGGMNIIEGIRDPDGRGWRVAHSLLMLAADAGFVWTGVTASGAGRYEPDSNQLRTQHRTVALGSMGVATIGYLMMLSPFRRN